MDQGRSSHSGLRRFVGDFFAQIIVLHQAQDQQHKRGYPGGSSIQWNRDGGDAQAGVPGSKCFPAVTGILLSMGVEISGKRIGHSPEDKKIPNETKAWDQQQPNHGGFDASMFRGNPLKALDDQITDGPFDRQVKNEADERDDHHGHHRKFIQEVEI